MSGHDNLMCIHIKFKFNTAVIGLEQMEGCIRLAASCSSYEKSHRGQGCVLDHSHCSYSMLSLAWLCSSRRKLGLGVEAVEAALETVAVELLAGPNNLQSIENSI